MNRIFQAQILPEKELSPDQAIRFHMGSVKIQARITEDGLEVYKLGGEPAIEDRISIWPMSSNVITIK